MHKPEFYRGLAVLVRGLADVDAQAELLAEVEQMSLGDTVAFIAIREADAIAAKAKIPVRTANSKRCSNMPRGTPRTVTTPRRITPPA